MIVPNRLNGGDMMGDLSSQNQAAENRRAVSASPADFIRWVSQSLREQRATYEKLKAEHKKLVGASDLATVGLKKLSTIRSKSSKTSLVRVGDKLRRDPAQSGDIVVNILISTSFVFGFIFTIIFFT